MGGGAGKQSSLDTTLMQMQTAVETAHRAERGVVHMFPGEAPARKRCDLSCCSCGSIRAVAPDPPTTLSAAPLRFVGAAARLVDSSFETDRVEADQASLDPGHSARPPPPPPQSTIFIAPKASSWDNIPHNIANFYDLERTNPAEGCFSSVCRGRHKQSGAVRAVRTIPKADMEDPSRLQKEIAIVRTMDHPNIARLHDTFQDHKSVYVIMDHCSGGELLDRALEEHSFSEAQCASLMEQIFRAIYYMHRSFICHRDLKPESFRFATGAPISRGQLKLVNFGLSCRFTQGQVLTTRKGTPYYIAPQVLQGEYNHLCDLWSAGVIAYVMLCGRPPFDGDTDQAVLDQVRRGDLCFDPQDWKHVSEDAIDLIRSLLRVDPRERFASEQALNHRWTRRKAPNAKEGPAASSFGDNLRAFRSHNKLKKAALQTVACRFSEEQVALLQQTFAELDRDGDGKLTARELREGLDRVGVGALPAGLARILSDLGDGGGVIDYLDFLEASMDQRASLQESVCWEAFRRFDVDGSGEISMDELRQVLADQSVQSLMGACSPEEIMRQSDRDGNSAINFDEFMQCVRR